MENKLNLTTPLFIVFEGIDGSGKSTQSDMVFEYLNTHLPVKKMVEPTDGKYGKKIRRMLRGDESSSPQEQLDLFLLDREDDTQKNILPALSESKIIVMDRYYYSNAAYQGAGGISYKSILDENRKRSFPEPDRVYFIDLSPESALKRIAKRNQNNERDIFEKHSFLNKVREIYLTIADDKFLIIDGEKSINEIFEIIKNDIIEKFNKAS